MIKNITNFEHKSWKKESNLSRVDFNQINIIFGHNGVGKSSLSKGIYQEYAKTSIDKENIRLFGSKYVGSTLLLEDNAGIRGVVSNFGKRDLELEQKIIINNRRLSEIEQEVKLLGDECSSLTEQTENFIRDIVTRRKDGNKKINNKPSDKSVHEKVELWIDDYQKAYKEFPNEDYNLITGERDFSTESEQLNNLRIPEMPNYDSDFAKELESILANGFPKINIPNSGIVSWVQSGIIIHKDKSICEFCGSKIQIERIQSKVNEYINDIRHKATIELEKRKDTLSKIIGTTEEIMDNSQIFISLLGLESAYFDRAKESLISLANTDRLILKKLQTMTEVYALPKDLSSDINTIKDVILDLSRLKELLIKQVIYKINRLEMLVKGAIGFEIQNTAAINENLRIIDEGRVKIKKYHEEVKELRNINSSLESQKTDLSDFSIFLNTVLVDLNLNFKLELKGKCYILKHIDETDLKVTDISDGERNILAMIYFYYEMLKEFGGTLKDGIDLIIIDDPISSLDDGNKFYITELIKSILDQDKVQVFVLTHSWDDFCNLTYGRDFKKNVTGFEIVKDRGISLIEEIDKKRLVKPYKALYGEVYLFSEKDASSIIDREVLHIPNIMRRVIEEYIKFVVDIDLATANKNSDISKAILGKEIDQLSDQEKLKLNQMLTICNVLSHKSHQPKNGNEVHQVAKFLMKSISKNNKFHHFKMIEGL